MPNNWLFLALDEIFITVIPPTPPPSNEPSEWAVESIKKLTSLGITDGTRPKEFATREEVMVMIARLLDTLQ